MDLITYYFVNRACFETHACFGKQEDKKTEVYFMITMICDDHTIPISFNNLKNYFGISNEIILDFIYHKKLIKQNPYYKQFKFRTPDQAKKFISEIRSLLYQGEIKWT